MEDILRSDLINCYRLIHRHGMSDLISSHASCRAETNGSFLTPRFGVLSESVSESDLCEVSLESTWQQSMAVSPSAVYLHSAIYRMRPDVRAIIHTHAVYGVAFSSIHQKLKPISQFALPFVNRLGYVSYKGPLTTREKCAEIADQLGANRALIMKNHGLLTVGASMSEAFCLMYYLNLSCRIQLIAQSSGVNLEELSGSVLKMALDDLTSGPYEFGKMEWDALVSDLSCHQDKVF